MALFLRENAGAEMHDFPLYIYPCHELQTGKQIFCLLSWQSRKQNIHAVTLRKEYVVKTLKISSSVSVQMSSL